MAATGHEQMKATVIFDGDCPFCIANIKKIRGFDREHNLDYLPRQAAEAEQRFPQIEGIDLEQGILVVDPAGAVWVAADGMYEIWRRLPIFRRFAPLYQLPGIKQAARGAYRLIAANRKRLGQVCSGQSCRLD